MNRGMDRFEVELRRTLSSRGEARVQLDYAARRAQIGKVSCELNRASSILHSLQLGYRLKWRTGLLWRALGRSQVTVSRR